MVRNNNRGGGTGQRVVLPRPTPPGNPPKIAIVITHYKMPHMRAAHFGSWNHKIIFDYLPAVFVVTDSPHLAVSRSSVLQYPGEMEIFSLAKTSNFGIRTAILEGFDIIIKTDVDCVISDNLFQQMISIDEKEAVCPIYHMAESYGTRESNKSKPWRASKGTFAMHRSAWEKVRGYDERMHGYGIEDGDLFDRVHRAGVKILRFGQFPIYHIAHDNNQAKNSRGCWNRKNGFNPKKHNHNTAIRRLHNWCDPYWGLAV